MRAVFILLLSALLLGVGLWFWFERSGQQTQDPAPVTANAARSAAPAARPVPVGVATVVPRRFETVLDSLGTAQANESVTLTATVTAMVTEVAFRDGDEVVAGQVLVRLASAEEAAERRHAQATLVEQRRELERIRGLVADGVVPVQQMDQQRTRVEEAEARLAAMDARLAERVIRAPFSGVLGLRRVSTGALVTPGTAIAELDDISLIKVDFTVPEAFLAVLRRGMPVTVRSAATRERVFTGEVTAISTRVDVATRTFTVRAEIDNQERQLRPGMLLSTRLFLDPADHLAIPEGALVVTGDQHFVFLVDDDNRVTRQSVRIGRRQPGWVEVLDGLTAGQHVVVEGVLRVRAGSTVQVVASGT